MKRIIAAIFWTGLFINTYFFIAIAKVYLKAAAFLHVPFSTGKLIEGYWNFLTFKTSPRVLNNLLGEFGGSFPFAFWTTVVALIILIVLRSSKKSKDKG